MINNYTIFNNTNNYLSLQMTRVFFGSSTNKTDCHDITEILFKVALNIITLQITANMSLKTHILTWDKH